MSVQLFCGDCLDSMKTLKENSVDLILTDPPYNLGLFMKNRNVGVNRMRDNYFALKEWDNMSCNEWETLLDLFFEESSRVLRIGGGMIVFMAIIKVESVIQIAQRHGLYYKTTGIWHKTNPMPRNMNLHFINSIEPWIYFINNAKTGTFNNNGEAIHDFVETSVVTMNEKKYGKHPTAKPEKLMNHFVQILSNDGDTVLDPFMGSGTVGVVCCNNNRNFIGIEINSEYFDMASKRIKGAEEKSRQIVMRI